MSRRGSSPTTLPAALLLTLCGHLTLGAAPPAESDDLVAAMTRALAAGEQGLRDGEHQMAESSYRDALLEGWLAIGHLELRQGRLAEAAAAFDRAATAAVETRRPWLARARVELRRGRAQEAVSLVLQVLARDRDDLDARRLLARALVEAGKVDEGVQVLEEIRVLAPGNLESTYLLASAYLAQGRPAAAEPLFAELAERRPTAQTHVLIGRTYRDHDAFEGARAALRQALALDPAVRRAHYYLGTVAIFEHGLDLLDEAMAEFAAEVELAPDDPRANLYLGMALVEKRRYDEALPRLEVACRASDPQPTAFLLLGRASLALDRPAEAAVALERALEMVDSAGVEMRGLQDPWDGQLTSRLHYLLAQARRQLGDPAAADRHFAAAKRLSAESMESSREQLRRYLGSEGPETVLAAFAFQDQSAPFAALDPVAAQRLEQIARQGLLRAYFNLGVLQTRAERFARAAGLFEQAAEIDAEFPQLQYSLGTAHFQAGRFDRAAAALARAREIAPDDPTLRRMLALAWLNSRQYERAAELLQHDPGRATDRALDYAYAVALVRSDRAAEAEAVFGRLLLDNPDWPELNVVIGQARAQQHDYEAAVGALRRAIELDPGVAEAHGTLGDIFLRQGKLDAAEEALREEVRRHPDDRRARHSLAVVLDLNRKPDEAMELLRTLLADEPELADGRYLLGKMLLARGDAEAASRQLEVAAGLAPRDSNIRYQLAQAYQALGRDAEAREAFDTYRRLKRESDG